MNRQLRAPEHRDPLSVFTQRIIQFLCLLLLPTSALPMMATVVQWELFQGDTSNCTLPAGTQIPCGDYGLFVIDPVYPSLMPITPCSAGSGGQETPPGFAARKITIHQGNIGTGVSISFPLTNSKGLPLTSSVQQGSSAPPWTTQKRRQPTSFDHKATALDLPCALGSCFADRTQPMSGPWIATFDWDDWHGWTVGWTISMLANHEIPVALYAFEDLVELEPELGVTDLHLLGLACSLAQDIDNNNFDRPLVVNMSFGRPEAPTDGDTPDCEYLSCQIGKVFDHLTTGATAGTPETTLVAAAGNHQKILFPAADDRALVAGSMDLAQFNSNNQLTSSWETVDLEKPLQHLMPGNPFCLNYWSDSGEERAWEAPAGSSYASAALTGWLARQQKLAPIANPAAAALTPVWAPKNGEANSLYLAQGTQTLIEFPPAARNLLARSFGKFQGPCGVFTQQPNLLHITNRGTTTSTATLGPSIAESQEESRPTPPPDPCVPCALIDDGGAYSKSLGTPLQPSTSKASARTAVQLAPLPPPTQPPPPGPAPVESPVYLDLSAHSDMPNRQTIVHIFLRIDSTLHDLGLTPQQLDDFSNGTYTHLALHGFNDLFCAGKQPSLVYKILLEDTGEEVWSSTPIFLTGNTWPKCDAGP